ncbi:MAG: fibro-slime domain-containing protein [Chitinivibrionales bacterium]|nr:fibro-slime domain-containing protein [Chitinivibrionales bacterium]
MFLDGVLMAVYSLKSGVVRGYSKFSFQALLIISTVILAGFVRPIQAQDPDSVVDTSWFQVIIRDFNSEDHPDFETFQGSDARTGAVATSIDTTDDTSSIAGDERGPRLLASAVGTKWSGEDNFEQWYNDVSGVNRKFAIELPFLVHANGLVTYIDSNFFPLNSGEPYVSLNDPALEPFDDYYDGNNFSFTTEFHATFTYLQDKDQVFSFTGDDDVWVFINDSLVIDLGGVHPPRSASVRLNDLPDGFLEDGKTYTFDFFHAERHTVESNVRITTSIKLNIRKKTKIVKAKIRDFKEKNTIDTAGMHPDFNYYSCGPTYGMVQNTIFEGVQNSPFPGDHRQVVLKSGAGCATTTSNFGQWYNDVAGVNRPFYIDIQFDEIDGEPGVYGISFPQFFPIDNDSNWTPAYPGGPDPYGHLQTDHPDHNYGFTTEIHTQVTYNEGTGQFFIFRGDDDVWAFVNDSLVMDLGGVHSAISDSIRLDSLPDGFLVDGVVYPFDFYHAERYIPDSRVTIKTNFQLDTYVFEGIETLVQFSNFQDFTDADTIEAYVKASNTFYIQVYDDSKTKGVDTTEIELIGPDGERETVQLIEAGTGTYRGSIDFGDPGARVSNNDVFDVGIDDDISFSFLGIGQEDQGPITGTVTLTAFDSEIAFGNSSSYSDLASLSEFRKRSDSLFIQITDDSKTSGEDEVTIELAGPDGESETVTLTESSPTVYRGVIAFGQSTDRTSGNDILNVAVGDELSYTYNGINEDQKTGSTTLEGQAAKVEFFNTGNYSNEIIGGSYGRYNDTLYIQVTDDSKTPDTDEITITIEGPSGERETITLTETEPGIYRGSIPFAPTDSRTADNDALEIDIGETYTYTYNGIGEPDPTTSTTVLSGALGQVYYANTDDYSDQAKLTDFYKTGDLLYIRVYDDDKTAGIDTVTIKLMTMGSEEEVVTLIETSAGVYDGSIAWGNASDKVAHNGGYDITIDEQFQYKYDPIGEPAGDIEFGRLKGVETPVMRGLQRGMIMKFQALTTAGGSFFTLPEKGILTLYSLDGRVITRNLLQKNSIFAVPSEIAGKMVLYTWQTKSIVKQGRMLVVK